MCVKILPWSSEKVQGLRYDEWLNREASKWERSYSTQNGGTEVFVRSKYFRNQLPSKSFGKAEARTPGAGTLHSEADERFQNAASSPGGITIIHEV